jgi:uncharacterized RDD family membrane protein YckC
MHDQPGGGGRQSSEQRLSQQPPQGYTPYPQYPPSGNVYATGPSGPRASFGQRLGALVLDTVILGIGLAIVLGIVAALTFPNVEFDADGNITEGGGAFVGFIAIAIGASVVGPLLYYSLLEGGASGQTLGKKAAGIRVISFDTGAPLGFARALGRNALRMVFSFVLNFIGTLLDGLWMLWDDESQTLHDKAVRSVVVPVSAYPVRR